ncbi:recombinase family protein, partial [Escherichia coli]
MLIGYIRVSTNDQNTDLQRNALMCAGCEQIFEDKMSGTKSERPGLKRALKCLKRGDTCKRLVRTVLIFTESSDQLSRATDRVP